MERHGVQIMLVFSTVSLACLPKKFKSTWIGIPGMDANLDEHDLNAVLVVQAASACFQKNPLLGLGRWGKVFVISEVLFAVGGSSVAL